MFCVVWILDYIQLAWSNMRAPGGTHADTLWKGNKCACVLEQVLQQVYGFVLYVCLIQLQNLNLISVLIFCVKTTEQFITVTMAVMISVKIKRLRKTMQLTPDSWCVKKFNKSAVDSTESVQQPQISSSIRP